VRGGKGKEKGKGKKKGGRLSTSAIFFIVPTTHRVIRVKERREGRKGNTVKREEKGGKGKNGGRCVYHYLFPPF